MCVLKFTQKQDVIFSVVTTSAFFTLIIPLVVFCKDVAHLEQQQPPILSPTIPYLIIRSRYYVTIVSHHCLHTRLTSHSPLTQRRGLVFVLSLRGGVWYSSSHSEEGSPIHYSYCRNAIMVLTTLPLRVAYNYRTNARPLLEVRGLVYETTSSRWAIQ